MRSTNDIFLNIGVTKESFVEKVVDSFIKASICIYILLFVIGNLIIYGLTDVLLFTIIYALLTTLLLLQVLDKRFVIIKRIKLVNLYLSNPFMLSKLVKTESKIDVDDIPTSNLKDLTVIDRRMAMNCAKYYKFDKYILPVVIYVIVSSLILLVSKLYNFNLSEIVYSVILLSYIAILTVFAIFNIFRKVYIKMLYSKFSEKIDRLYTKGYITPLQYKAIYICNARYLDSGLVSADEFRYLIVNEIVDKRTVVIDYINMKFRYIVNSALLGFAIIGVMYIYLYNDLYFNSVSILGWLLLMLFIKCLFEGMHKIILGKCDNKEFLNSVLDRMVKDDKLMSNIVINHLPNSVLEDL